MRRRFQSGARADANSPVDDDLIAAFESIENEPAVAIPCTGSHRPLLCLAILAYDPDEMRLRALLDGALRNDDAVRTYRAEHVDVAEFPRPQLNLRVRKHRAHEERPGFLGKRRDGQADVA